jgi:chromate reductase, NAD(P)H dehydrogenase (quinone)
MTISVLGISGSLRVASHNTAALRAAQGLAPAGMTVQIADISGVPLYQEEVYQAGFPSAVETLREQIRTADALLIATPEYNFSFSGVLKNAIDWVSRPPSHPFDGKPIGIIGASGGRLGTARAQYHLRQVFVFLNGQVLNKPEVMIGGANSAFADGKLVDEAGLKGIGDMLTALAAAVEKNR